MTPFYLFFGALLIYIFQSHINLNKLKGFASIFLILFIFSPFAYAYVSITQTDKRTDYPGKEIAKTIQKKWDNQYTSKINFVMGDEWRAGNLSYHLKSRPKWLGAKEIPCSGVCGKKFDGVNYMYMFKTYVSDKIYHRMDFK